MHILFSSYFIEYFNTLYLYIQFWGKKPRLPLLQYIQKDGKVIMIMVNFKHCYVKPLFKFL